jgi:hypothetical protein
MKTIKLEQLKEHLDHIILAEDEDTAIPEDEQIDLADPAKDIEEIEENTVTQDGVFTDESEGDLANNKQNETAETSSKFKSVEDLEKAYLALQKEFTRRCQRLSKLEKELKDSVEREETPEEWKGKVDKFFNENPHAKPFRFKQLSCIEKRIVIRHGNHFVRQGYIHHFRHEACPYPLNFMRT